MYTTYSRNRAAERVTRWTSWVIALGALAFLFQLDVVGFLVSVGVTALAGVLVIGISDKWLGSVCGYGLGLGLGTVTVYSPTHDLLYTVVLGFAFLVTVTIGFFVVEHYESTGWTTAYGVLGFLVSVGVLHGVM